jgi:hypothetical protein
MDLWSEWRSQNHEKRYQNKQTKSDKTRRKYHKKMSIEKHGRILIFSGK